MEDRKLVVSNMSYVNTKEMRYEDVFSGYSCLKVITYSYGLSFLSKIASGFERVEVLFGYAELAGSLTEHIVKVQYGLLEEIGKYQYVHDRMLDRTMELRVLRDEVSHMKVYLLSDPPSGRYRTVLTSANFSETAWRGFQKEQFVVCDEKPCYDCYVGIWDGLWKESLPMNGPSGSAAYFDPDAADVLPVFREAKKDVLVLGSTREHVREETEYVLHAEQITPELKKALSAARIKENRNGLVKIRPQSVQVFQKSLKAEIEQRVAVRQEQPNFEIDLKSGMAMFEDAPFPLEREEADIRSDISCLMEFMSGYDKFYGDKKELQFCYWKALHYLFVSPFLGRLRKAAQANGLDDRLFPAFLLIVGSSDCGKTTFVTFVRQLMFGKEQAGILKAKDCFKSDQMMSLRHHVHGYPIVMDELPQTSWSHNRGFIKSEMYIDEEHDMDMLPCIILLSNDIHNVAPEFRKRVMVMEPDARATGDYSVELGNRLSNLRRRAGCSLYAEYLRRMIPEVRKLLSGMEGEDPPVPDIWKRSSSVLSSLLREYGFRADFVSVFDFKACVGTRHNCKKAVDQLLLTYRTSPGCFSFSGDKQQIRVDFSGWTDMNEANRLRKLFRSELPPQFECRTSEKSAILNYRAVRRYTGEIFDQATGYPKPQRKGLFQRARKMKAPL